MRAKKVEIAGAAALILALLIPWWYHSRHVRPVEAPILTTTSTPTPQPEKSKNQKLKTSPLPSPGALRHFDHAAHFPRLIYIPEGKAREIFASLRRQGVPLWGLDRFLLLPSKITPGWIRLDRPLSLAEFFRHINDFPREKTRRVVMYSGDSFDDFVRRFSRQTRLPSKAVYEEYFRYSPYIDGGILAGYYRLPYRLSPGPALAYLTGRSERRFARLAKRYLGRYDPAEFKRYLIIASIVQRETWHPEEMPHIASVILNRLSKGMRLQIDSTLNYGPWSHKIVTPERIRRDTSRFNTYRFRGLPPEPLGSVTVDALRAALHPAKSEDLYFVRNLYGIHDFARDYATHLANISRIKKERANLNRYKREAKRMQKDQ